MEKSLGTNVLELEDKDLNKKDYSCSYMEEIAEVILECSKFYKRDLAFLLADVVSFYEGDTYWPRVVSYYDTTFGISGWHNVLVIVKEDDRVDSYVNRVEIKEKQKQGKLVVVDDFRENGDTISCYNIFGGKTRPYEISALFNEAALGRFSYIKDFVDLLVSFRISKKFNLSWQDEERVKLDFFGMKLDEIKKRRFENRGQNSEDTNLEFINMEKVFEKKFSN